MPNIPDNLNPIAAFIAVLLGGLWGHRYDPVTWLLLVFCIAFGALRWRPYAPLIATALAASFNVYAVFSWWTELGIADQWKVRSIWIFLFSWFSPMSAMAAVMSSPDSGPSRSHEARFTEPSRSS